MSIRYINPETGRLRTAPCVLSGQRVGSHGATTLTGAQLQAVTTAMQAL